MRLKSLLSVQGVVATGPATFAVAAAVAEFTGAFAGGTNTMAGFTVFEV